MTNNDIRETLAKKFKENKPLSEAEVSYLLSVVPADPEPKEKGNGKPTAPVAPTHPPTFPPKPR